MKQKFYAILMTMVVALLAACNSGPAPQLVNGADAYYVFGESDTPGKNWVGVSRDGKVENAFISVDKDSIRFIKDLQVYLTHKAGSINLFDLSGKRVNKASYTSYEYKDRSLLLRNEVQMALFSVILKKEIGPFDKIEEGMQEFFSFNGKVIGAFTAAGELFPPQYDEVFIVYQNMPKDNFYLVKKQIDQKKVQWTLLDKNGKELNLLSPSSATRLLNEAKRSFSKYQGIKGGVKWITVSKISAYKK